MQNVPDYQPPTLKDIKNNRKFRSRSNKTFLRKLDTNYNRSLDSIHSSRVQDYLCSSTYTVETETNKSKVERGFGFYKRSYLKTPSQGFSESCTGGPKPVHFNIVHCKTNIQRKTDFQFKESQSVCGFSEIRDGKSGGRTQADPTGRLHDEIRSPRSIFFSTNSQQSQEISAICVPRNNIRVPMASIRIVQCYQDFYKTVKTSDSNAANTRNMDCDLPGRHASSGSKPRKAVVNF